MYQIVYTKWKFATSKPASVKSLIQSKPIQERSVPIQKTQPNTCIQHGFRSSETQSTITNHVPDASLKKPRYYDPEEDILYDTNNTTLKHKNHTRARPKNIL